MTGSPLEQRLAAELQRLKAQNLHRVRRVVSGPHGAAIEVDGRRCVNFCSNDYLGLAGDPRVAKAAQRALDESGTGSGAAALVSGYNAEHRKLEEALAQCTGYPRALLFSSGWAANLGALKALLGKGDRLVADELNHASLIDGGRLSGARYLRYAHGDARAAERILVAPHAGQTLLVTDSVFSMDGDVAPVAQLGEAAAQSGAGLMVDDAHGFGVLGATGLATLASTRPDVYVATLGKALGVAGAFVAGSEALVDYLVQRARSWVFSTAPPPALAAAARCALGIMQSEPERRGALAARVARFRDGAQARGIVLPESHTAIQPLVLGEESRALALSATLARAGYWVAAIRPPTVPAGTARLRITLSATHSDREVDGLLDALAAGLRELQRAA